MIHEGDEFVTIFEADGPVINNCEDFCWKEINQADFFGFNPFRRMVSNERAFGTFLEI